MVLAESGLEPDVSGCDMLLALPTLFLNVVVHVFGVFSDDNEEGHHWPSDTR